MIVDPPNLLCEMTPMRHYSCIQPRPSIFRAAQPFQLPGSCILTPTFACCLLAMLEPRCSWLSGSRRDRDCGRHRASARESFRARCQLRQNRAPEAMCTAYRSQAEGQVEKPQLKHLTPSPFRRLIHQPDYYPCIVTLCRALRLESHEWGIRSRRQASRCLFCFPEHAAHHTQFLIISNNFADCHRSSQGYL